MLKFRRSICTRSKTVIILVITIFILGGLLLLTAQCNKKTSVAFVIKAERFSFIVDSSSTIILPMKLRSELTIKSISLTNVHSMHFQSGKFIDRSQRAKEIKVSEMAVKTIAGDDNANIQLMNQVDGFKFLELKVYPEVQVTVEKNNKTISFNFESVIEDSTRRVLYESELALNDTSELVLRECKIMDKQKPIKEIGFVSYRIEWIPESSKNIYVHSGFQNSKFEFELKDPQSGIELFANFKVHNIKFSRLSNPPGDSLVESAILDSSFIRIFDPNREDIRLLRKDDFQAEPDSFTMELITLAKDGFWLYFHGKLNELRIGKQGYFGDNQILNWLVWLSQRKTLIIIVAVLIWFITELLKVLPIIFWEHKKEKTRRTRAHTMTFTPRRLRNKQFRSNRKK